MGAYWEPLGSEARIQSAGHCPMSIVFLAVQNEDDKDDDDDDDGEAWECLNQGQCPVESIAASSGDGRPPPCLSVTMSYNPLGHCCAGDIVTMSYIVPMYLICDVH